MPQHTSSYDPEQLKPIYGGPTLLEALWAEMDAIVERLMEDSQDMSTNPDRYRAEELAWVLAIVSNPYEPDMDRIRAKAMERWRGEDIRE